MFGKKKKTFQQEGKVCFIEFIDIKKYKNI